MSLIDSVKVQTIKPIVWFILDDGSTDDTPNILKNCISSCDWIKILHFEEHSRDLGLHLAEIMGKGFDSSIAYCKQKGLEYNYLGNLDGDLSIPATFFENLINEFEKNPRLGVASGGTKNIIGNRTVYVKLSINEPSGGHMLIRRKCFENIGGKFPISYASDSVLKAKARIRGWETKRFEDNIATEVRDVSSAEGYWKGAIENGKRDYYLNFSPLFVLVRSTKYFKKFPYYIGFGYLYGYLVDLISRKSQVQDEEIRNYFRNKWNYKTLGRYLTRKYLRRIAYREDLGGSK